MFNHDVLVIYDIHGISHYIESLWAFTQPWSTLETWWLMDGRISLFAMMSIAGEHALYTCCQLLLQSTSINRAARML